MRQTLVVAMAVLLAGVRSGIGAEGDEDAKARAGGGRSQMQRRDLRTAIEWRVTRERLCRRSSSENTHS